LFDIKVSLRTSGWAPLNSIDAVLIGIGSTNSLCLRSAWYVHPSSTASWWKRCDW